MKLMIACFIFLTASILPAPLWSEESANQFRQRPAAIKEIGLTKEDIRTEVLFGQEVAARIIGRSALYENPEIMRYVNLVGNALTVHTNRPELEFHFAILENDEINSYAAPGGYIFITTGALLAMQDEAELAGILAHEIAHIAKRDIVRYLDIRARESNPQTGLALFIGGPSQTTTMIFLQIWDQNNTVEKALDILFKNGYKQTDEFIDDKAALHYAAFAGYDPHGLVRYFERLRSMKGKHTGILDKTHPSYKERINRLMAAIQEEGLEGSASNTFPKRFTEIKKLIQ
jgi:predicted Zn-dependent protease